MALADVLRLIFTIDVLKLIKKPVGFKGWFEAVEAVLIPQMNKFKNEDPIDLGNSLMDRTIVDRRATVKLEKDAEKDKVRDLARALIAGDAAAPVPAAAPTVPNLDPFVKKAKDVLNGRKGKELSDGEFLGLMRDLAALLKTTPEHKTFKEADLSAKFIGHAHSLALILDESQEMEAGKRWCAANTCFGAPGAHNFDRTSFQRKATEEASGQWYVRVSEELARAFSNQNMIVEQKKNAAQEAVNLNTVMTNIAIGLPRVALDTLWHLASAKKHIQTEYCSLVITAVYVCLHFALHIEAVEWILELSTEMRELPHVQIAVAIMRAYLTMEVNWAELALLQNQNTFTQFRLLQHVLWEMKAEIHPDELWWVDLGEDLHHNVFVYDVIPRWWGLPEWKDVDLTEISEALEKLSE